MIVTVEVSQWVEFPTLLFELVNSTSQETVLLVLTVTSVP